jgi:hypothetical protein
MKQVLWATGIIGVFILVWVFALHGLFFKSVIKSIDQNIERKVFENTQSYVHGKRQELSKMFSEYTNNPEKRETITTLVRVQFADFPADKINNVTLRNWLIDRRGY